MKLNNKQKYGIITLILFVVSVIMLVIIDRTNNINLSLAIQLILILYLSKVVYGMVLYIKEQYQKQKYSYSIIMNLGLAIFLIVNIIRQVALLIVDFGKISIVDIYNSTLESFSYFAILILPLIAFLGVYSIITNIILIKKEGFGLNNILGMVFAFIIIIGAFSTQMIYEYTSKLTLSMSGTIIKNFIDISLNSILAYFYCLVLATLYCNIMAGKHNPTYDKDFVIVLGSQIKKDGTLTPLLKSRVDRAILFSENQKKSGGKDVVFVTSGGQGIDEIMPEGEAIKNYLLQRGIKEENIIVEDKSTSTKENIKFSKEKIDEINKDAKIAFSTTNYHVFRSGVIANNQGVECEGMGSKTKIYFYVNALLREFFANLITEKNKHFVLITSINLALLILVLIGYFCKLI